MKKFIIATITVLCMYAVSPVLAAEPHAVGPCQQKQIQIHMLIDRYEQTLGFYKNPFLFAFTVDDANSIYDSLLWQSQGILCSESILFKVQQELKQVPLPAEPNLSLMDELITDSLTMLAQTDTEIRDLQSNLLALKSAIDYLRKFESCLTKDVEAVPTQPPMPKPTPPPVQNKQKKAPQPPEYPELNSTYKPHTKELPQDDESQTKTIIATANFKTALFGQMSYPHIVRNNVYPFQSSSQLAALAQPVHAQGVDANTFPKKLSIRPLGKKRLKLFLPAGHVPATWSLGNAKIQVDDSGAYELTFENVHDEIEIPLIEETKEQLTTIEHEVLTQLVGIHHSEWPEAIQSSLIHPHIQARPQARIQVAGNHAKIAQAIAEHISKNYLYSTGARPETDPIDALKAGAFQCDMAAYIMVSLLRDVHQIPSRVVAGYRAKKYQKGNAHKSYLVMPSEGHAWVEVFHDGAWHSYDPTPRRKDKEDEKDKEEKSEYHDISLEELKEPQKTEKQQQESQEKAASKEQEVKDELEKEKQAHQEKESSEPYFLPELVEALSHLNYNEIKDDNLLRCHVLKHLLIDIFNPLRSSETTLHKLNLAKNLFNLDSSNTKDLIAQALRIHKEPHDPLIGWLKNLNALVLTQDINQTHQELLSMIKILTLYEKVTNADSARIIIRRIIEDMRMALTLLHPLKDANAADMALVHDFKQSSPLLLWKAIEHDYSLTSVGANLETIKLADDIKAGKHNDKLLLNELYDHTNFILNATEKPGSQLVKTWLRESRKIGRDFLPLQRVDDWSHALVTNPLVDLIENIHQGSAYVLTKRQKVPIFSKKQHKESDRMTIVGFDTSGSMAGRNSEFQAALIAAFVSRALNDISPSGRHRHRVLLVPFDHTVQAPISVTSIREAINLISNHQTLLKNTGGGTDIQAFILQAMKLIADAQNNKNPFDTANIIVMTDGESPINYDELRKARGAIHRETPLQTMFIALGSNTNSELMKFALDSEKMGAKGSYKQFSEHDMAKIISDAGSIDLKKYESYYYTSKTPDNVPVQIKHHLLSAISDVETLAHEINRLTVFPNHRNHLNVLRQHHPEELYAPRSIEHWVKQIRQMFAAHPIFHEEQTVNYVLQKLIEDFETITNVPIRDLNHHETEEMVHLFENPLDIKP